ncbi:cadherin-like domain-containing protein [Candidatus Nomurabacteria bacterium]|nr:cadherin-like domain-containing protein [Candidatus Nomurabacteria bacterium]
MSKISKKITALSYSAIALLSFVPIISTQAATTTLDVSPSQNQTIVGDPYGSGPDDTFDDFLLSFDGTFPVSSGLLGASTGNGDGFDTAFVVPQPASNCTRYLNQATIEIEIIQNDGMIQGFGIGLSEDSGATLNTDGTFSASLPYGLAGFGTGEIDPELDPAIGIETFATPIMVTNDTLFLLAVEDSDGVIDVEYSINNIVFNVTDNCTNQVPVANPDNTQVSANQAVTFNVLANDTDPDNDSFTVTSAVITSGDMSGTVTINSDGTLTYQPTDGFTGTTMISYTIDDGNGGQATSTMTVNVLGVSDTVVETKDVTPLTTLPKAGIPVAIFSILATAIILSVYKLRQHS